MNPFPQITPLLLAFYLIAFSISLPAQLNQTSSSKASSSLNDQQVRGEGVFLQRCSLCHLPQARRQVPTSQPVGPYLTSLLKNAGVEKERAVREVILKGGPRMPGFQYGLTPKEVDDLVAYLKTL